MVGIVLVSHSKKLVEGIKEVLDQMNHKEVPIAFAGGTDNEDNPIGTDPGKILEALNYVLSHKNNAKDGAIVFMDLGSAIMSTETAIEMLEDEYKGKVVMSFQPIFEASFLSMFHSMENMSRAEIIEKLDDCLYAKREAVENYNSER